MLLQAFIDYWHNCITSSNAIFLYLVNYAAIFFFLLTHLSNVYALTSSLFFNDFCTLSSSLKQLGYFEPWDLIKGDWCRVYKFFHINVMPNNAEIISIGWLGLIFLLKIWSVFQNISFRSSNLFMSVEATQKPLGCKRCQ